MSTREENLQGGSFLQPSGGRQRGCLLAVRRDSGEGEAAGEEDRPCVADVEERAGGPLAASSLLPVPRPLWNVQGLPTRGRAEADSTQYGRCRLLGSPIADGAKTARSRMRVEERRGPQESSWQAAQQHLTCRGVSQGWQRPSRKASQCQRWGLGHSTGRVIHCMGRLSQRATHLPGEGTPPALRVCKQLI